MKRKKKSKPETRLHKAQTCVHVRRGFDQSKQTKTYFPQIERKKKKKKKEKKPPKKSKPETRLQKAQTCVHVRRGGFRSK